VILLAEHDEPILAAKKKRQHGASSWPTSTPKNRVWGFENTPSGRPNTEPGLSWETATGSVQYTYQIASGRAEWLSRDRIGEAGGIDLYSYVNNDPVLYVDSDGLSPSFTITPGSNKDPMAQSVNISITGCACPNGHVEFKQWVSSFATFFTTQADPGSGPGGWYDSDSSGPSGASMSDFPGEHTVEQNQYGTITKDTPNTIFMLAWTGFTMTFKTCAYFVDNKNPNKFTQIGCRSWVLHWDANFTPHHQGFGTNLPPQP